MAGGLEALKVFNVAVDAVLGQRVWLHDARVAGRVSVAEYLDGLRAVRVVEDCIEPLRRELGAGRGRAFELCCPTPFPAAVEGVGLDVFPDPGAASPSQEGGA